MSEYCTHLTECARLLRNDELAAARAHLLVTCKSSHPTPSRRPTLLVFATNGATMQGEYNSAKQWYAAIAVHYHQGSKIRHGGRLIGTERAGNLLSARARVDSFLWHIILVEWQAKGKPIPDY